MHSPIANCPKPNPSAGIQAFNAICAGTNSKPMPAIMNNAAMATTARGTMVREANKPTP
jgi:hypothetical protein